MFLQIEDINRHKTMQCMKVTRGCINMTMEVDTRKLMGSLSNRQFPNVIQSVQNKDQSRCMASCHVLNISGTHTCKILIRSISPLDHYLHCLEQHTISRGFIHYTDTTKMERNCKGCSICTLTNGDMMVLGMMDQIIFQMLINEIDLMDEESGDDGGLVVSKEGDNGLDDDINGCKKGLEEVEELARAALSSTITNIVKYKRSENGDVPTTTRTTNTNEESS